MAYIAITGTSSINVGALTPLYMHEHHKEFKSSAIGVLLASYYIAFLIIAPIVGELAPKYGRKNILAWGLGLMVLGTLLFSMAAFVKNGGGFYAMSFTGRVLQGVAEGAACVIIHSIISIEFPEDNAKY